MAKDERSLVVQSYADKFSRRAVVEIMSMLEEEGRGKDKEYRDELVIFFLARFIGTIVYDVLKDKSKSFPSKKEEAEYITKNFGHIKERVSASVASGFQGAMSTFTGKDVEYYCQIKVVPPVTAKYPC